MLFGRILTPPGKPSFQLVRHTLDWTKTSRAEIQKGKSVSGRISCREPTVSKELQQCQVNRSFPAGSLWQRNAISRGCKHLSTADGNKLASLILPSHVIQNSSVVDEGVQLPVMLQNIIAIKTSSGFYAHKI